MTPAEKARIAGRKEAVKSGTSKGLSAKEARKRYYVRTRVAELEKKTGKPVSAEKRKQLREKFNSGDVSRKGFAAPKKKSVSSSSSVLADKPVSSTKGKSLTSQMQSVPGYKSGSAKPAGKKGRSSSGKTYDFVRNELLGVDDFSRVGKNLKKGNYGKAAKSAGAGVLELGSTVASLFGVGLGVKGAMGAAKAAKLAKGVKAIGPGSRTIKAVAVRKVPKAIGSGPKAIGPAPKAVLRKPAVKKPAVKKPPAKKPAVKKPVAKKPVAKKPVAKKPVAKKPAVKKPSIFD